MSAVEGGDTTAAIRARLDELYVLPAARQRYYAALLAVLDLCDASSRDHVGDGMGGISAGSVRCAIATALGVGTP